jgi:Tfp pilus assembly protein PilF
MTDILFRLKLTTCVFWTALFLIAGCSNSYEKAAEQAALAEAQLASGNLDAARMSIQMAIADRDDMTAYHILLARIEVQAQRPLNAFNAYSMAHDLEADNMEALQNIADLGLQIGRFEQAMKAADQILLLAPNSTGAMLVKGFIALDQSRLEDAAKIASEMLAIDPQDEGGVILSARLDALDQRPDDALRRLNALSEANGGSAAIDITQIEIFRLKADAAAMATLFPKIIAALPDNEEYPVDYLNFLYKTGDLQKAREYSLKLLGERKVTKGRINALARLWLEYDQPFITAGQVEQFARNAREGPSIALARYFLRAGKFDQAERAAARFANAGSQGAKGLISRSLLARGESSKAFASAAAILAADSRNVDALLVRHAQNVQNKQYENALKDANVASAEAPEEAAAYVALARAYRLLRRDIRARQTFEKGMDALPQDTWLAEAYKEFLRSTGDTDRIISLDRDVAFANPSSTRAWAIFLQSCQRYGDDGCAGQADGGLARAHKSFSIDEPPGTPRKRGIFSRISVNSEDCYAGQICLEATK